VIGNANNHSINCLITCLLLYIMWVVALKLMGCHLAGNNCIEHCEDGGQSIQLSSW